MARKSTGKKKSQPEPDIPRPPGRRNDDVIPPGATPAAHNRPIHPGGGPPGSRAGPRHMAGEPGGGGASGNLGEGLDVDDQEVDSPRYDAGDDPAEGLDAYAGPSGGAVGGTPAGLRAKGGRTHGGLTPGGTHRGDSTIGGDPDADNTSD
jgi:hypothetical protein